MLHYPEYNQMNLFSLFFKINGFSSIWIDFERDTFEMTCKKNYTVHLIILVDSSFLSRPFWNNFDLPRKKTLKYKTDKNCSEVNLLWFLSRISKNNPLNSKLGKFLGTTNIYSPFTSPTYFSLRKSSTQEKNVVFHQAQGRNQW